MSEYAALEGKLKGLDKYGLDEVRGVVGPKIHELVSNPATRRRLQAAYLSREIVRYTVSVHETTRELLVARERMLDQEHDTYVIRSAEAGRDTPVGLAYRMPGQRLKRQPRDMSLAGAKLAPIALSEVVDLDYRGPRVSAWITAGKDWGVLESAYTLLRTGSEEGRAWTLAPPPNPHEESYIGNNYAILMDVAGYTPEATGYFDDRSTTASDPIPLRTLYVARSEE